MSVAFFSRQAIALAGLLVVLLASLPSAGWAQAHAHIIVTGFAPPGPGPIIDNDPHRASVSRSQGGNFDSGGSWSWQASSGASVASGSVSSAVGVVTAGRGFGYVNALGSVSDELTFSGSGPVEFTLAVHGSFRALAESSFHAIGYLAFGDGTAGGVMNYVGNTPNFTTVRLAQTTGEALLISNAPSNAIAWFTARTTVAAGVPVGIYASLNLDLTVGDTDIASANFLHTAQLWLTMPDDMSFTSASGVFLTEAVVTPVPEPETWALMLAGLGSLTLLSRRRRRAR